jgi:hypothetical protein
VFSGYLNNLIHSRTVQFQGNFFHDAKSKWTEECFAFLRVFVSYVAIKTGLSTREQILNP